MPGAPAVSVGNGPRLRREDRRAPNIRWTHNRSRPMKRLALALCLAALVAPALDAQDATATAPAPAPTAARRRVAVLDFDYGAVHNSVTGVWGSDVDIGKGVGAMLLSELMKNGTYTVIERSQVERILNEQNLGQEGRVAASTAATLGRLLGADAIIMGSITQFGSADKKVGMGGGGFHLGGIGLGGLGRKTSKEVGRAAGRERG